MWIKYILPIIQSCMASVTQRIAILGIRKQSDSNNSFERFGKIRDQVGLKSTRIKQPLLVGFWYDCWPYPEESDQCNFRRHWIRRCEICQELTFAWERVKVFTEFGYQSIKILHWYCWVTRIVIMVSQKRNKIKYQEFTQRLLLEIVLKTYESDHISKGKDLDKIVKDRLHPW